MPRATANPSADERASFAAQRAWRDAIVPCEVFECIDLTLCLLYTPLQDLNTSVGRDADVALIKIYAVRHRLEVPCIFDRLTVALKFSFPAFELSSQC
jgi:hypothetical protein